MALRPSQRLAQRHVETVADHAIINIETIRRYATYIVYAVMGASFFHQFAYLFKTFGVKEFAAMGTFEGWLHAVSYGAGAALIPIIFDFFTVVCVMAVSSAALKIWVRVLALVLVLAPVGASGYINWNSSIGPDGRFAPAIAIIYLMVVALIPLTELMRAASHEIDYPAIEKMELKALAQVEEKQAVVEPVAPAKVLDEMDLMVLRFGKDLKSAQAASSEYARLDKSQKQSWSKRYVARAALAEQEMADPAAAAGRTVPNAPVSPAVAVGAQQAK